LQHAVAAEILNKSIPRSAALPAPRFSLSRAKALAKLSGGKLNDVLLVLASGVCGAICCSRARCRPRR